MVFQLRYIAASFSLLIQCRAQNDFWGEQALESFLVLRGYADMTVLSHANVMLQPHPLGMIMGAK